MMRSTAEPRAARHALAGGLAAVAAVAGLGGCATAPPAAPAAAGRLGAVLSASDGRVPLPLEPYVTADRAEGARNLVLNAMLAGKAALDIGALDQARRALNAAYEQIETIYADNPAAAQARSKFVPEANKDFKGEPYERTMVGYYIGLADLLLGDLDNARASFTWGEFQDTMSAAEKYQGDTASLRYLLGWVHHCQGRHTSAQEAFRLAAALRPSMKAPAAGDNLLVLMEAGPPPRKKRSGRHGEELVYEPGPALGDELAVEAAVDGGKLSLVLAEDIHWQAGTLGGRAVDRILAGKAAFKDNATSVAQAGATVAVVGIEVSRVAAIAGDRRLLNLGLFGSLVGVAADLAGSAVAEATRAEADIRQWSNLPAAVFMGATRVDARQAGELRIAVQAPAVLGGASAAALAQAIPRTDCFVARLAPGAAGAAWDARDSRQWIALDELARRPLSARPSPSDPETRRPEPVKTAPVRATF